MDKTKQDEMNLYDRIREEQHEKQRKEADRQRRAKELFEGSNDDLLNRRMRGEK